MDQIPVPKLRNTYIRVGDIMKVYALWKTGRILVPVVDQLARRAYIEMRHSNNDRVREAAIRSEQRHMEENGDA